MLQFEIADEDNRVLDGKPLAFAHCHLRHAGQLRVNEQRKGFDLNVQLFARNICFTLPVDTDSRAINDTQNTRLREGLTRCRGMGQHAANRAVRNDQRLFLREVTIRSSRAPTGLRQKGLAAENLFDIIVYSRPAAA